MKKCPYCAEDIQDAAVKCRYCGSMLTDAPPPPRATPAAAPGHAAAPPPLDVDLDEVLPPDELDAKAGVRPAFIILGVIGAVLLLLMLSSLFQGDDSGAPEAAASAPARTAATLVPSARTEGEYRFLDLPWNTPRAEVRAQLEARGFRFLERDELGDEAYEGRIDGRDAGLDVRYAADALSKIGVILLPADPQGAVLMLTRQVIVDAFGDPQKQRDVATIWPERAGTLVWLTSNDERFVTVHFESAGWPAESRRRRGE